MAWMWIGKDADNNQVYINEEKGQVGFDQNGGDVPTADYEWVEFSDIDDLMNILCSNNVCCMS